MRILFLMLAFARHFDGSAEAASTVVRAALNCVFVVGDVNHHKGTKSPRTWSDLV